MIATGYILRFPLPPGTNKSHSLWGLSRHSWGSLHFWISVGLLGVLLLHIVLHWHWLVSVVAKRFGWMVPSEKRALQIAFLTAIVFVSLSAGFAWIASRSVELIQDAEQLDDSHSVRSDGETPRPAQADGDRTVLPTIFFSKDIAPIFERSCLSCHGMKRAAGNFRVDRKQDFFAESTGGPLVVPGKSSESPLIAIVSGQRTDIPLPDRHKLPDEDVTAIRTWIDAGAQWTTDQ